MINNSHLNTVLNDLYWESLQYANKFFMLINYANQLCKLMSGQIDKMSDQNDDLKGHMCC